MTLSGRRVPAEDLAAVAFDYDGTLSHDSRRPDPNTLRALDLMRRRGQKVLLVTGRIWTELEEVFPDVMSWFDAVVAENGCVLHSHAEHRHLARPLPLALRGALASGGVEVRAGEVLVEGRAADRARVQWAIYGVAARARVVLNRESLMVLPAGVSKATGLVAALDSFGLTTDTAIGVGDGDNDCELLAACALGVSVANGVPALKEVADIVLAESNGKGMAELLRLTAPTSYGFQHEPIGLATVLRRAAS